MLLFETFGAVSDQSPVALRAACSITRFIKSVGQRCFLNNTENTNIILSQVSGNQYYCIRYNAFLENNVETIIYFTSS